MQPPPGVFHRVVRGQTLYTIARTYGVALDEIIEVNEISDPHQLEVDRLLFIPGAEAIQEVPATTRETRPARGLFRMPVAAAVTSPYGPRRGRMHHGVDLGATSGTQVLAARDGVVSYAGSGYRGYGKLVILDHDGGFQTFYAHNRRLLTGRGVRVRAGQPIAQVGATGHASAPHLHFEIRLHGRPQDPSRYLSLR